MQRPRRGSICRKLKTDDSLGINRPVDSLAQGGGYTFIKDSLMTRPGFVRYWDDKAKAPYLWNAETRQLVVFDGEESVKIKCEYVKSKNMAGIMSGNTPAIQKSIY